MAINRADIEQEIERLQMLIEHHKKTLQLLGGEVGNGRRGRPAGKGKRTISAAGRAKIAAAQRARWAKVRKAAKSG